MSFSTTRAPQTSGQLEIAESGNGNGNGKLEKVVRCSTGVYICSSSSLPGQMAAADSLLGEVTIKVG